MLCQGSLATLNSELAHTGINREKNMVLSVQKMETIDSETASQWQRRFFLFCFVLFCFKLKALATERLNLPPSNVKESISIGVSRPRWAPMLETISALAEEGWTRTTSSVGLVSVACFCGQNFQTEVPHVRHRKSGTWMWCHGAGTSQITQRCLLPPRATSSTC